MIWVNEKGYGGGGGGGGGGVEACYCIFPIPSRSIHSTCISRKFILVRNGRVGG